MFSLNAPLNISNPLLSSLKSPAQASVTYRLLLHLSLSILTRVPLSTRPECLKDDFSGILDGVTLCFVGCPVHYRVFVQH